MTSLPLKIFAAASLLLAFALPTQAQAHCASMNGSYVVTCEKGVKVYRHQAKSALPMSLSNNQTSSQSDAQANRRAAVAQQLEARRISIAERRQAAEARNLNRQHRATSRRSAYSRRYVSFGGRGLANRRFNARNINARRVKAKH